MTINTAFTRRGFMAASGGLAVSLSFLPAGPGLAASGGGLGAWVIIDPDGTITIHAPAAEMGQGVQTVVPLILAEELDADWSRVKVETAPVDPAFANPIFKGQYTVASLTVRGYWMPARLAGAQVRRALIEAAAREWNIAPDGIVTEPSVVVAPDGRKLGYGEIAALKSFPETLAEVAPEHLKPVSEFRLLGRDVPRVDIPAKSSGRAKYAIDMSVPGMLIATLARAPVRDQKVAAFNEAEVAALPGVSGVVNLGHGVAVLGKRTSDVFAARKSLKIDWTGDVPGTRIDSDRDAAEYLDRLRDKAEAPDAIYATKGAGAEALANAAEVVSAEFTTDYCYHAQMEPMGALAWVRDGAADIWTGTQWQTMALNKTARHAGLEPGQVTVHQLYMGGGYGRRAHTEYIDDAVRLSKAVNAPVKLLLSREDDLASARLRPLTAQRVEMGLDDKGRIMALRHAVAVEPVAPYMYGPERWQASEGRDIITMRGSELPHYKVEHQVAEAYHEMRGARVAAWRGIGSGYTKFALETMIDEIARSHGHDPLDYRLDMAVDDRVRNVLTKVADMAGWKAARPEGRAIGLGFAEYGLSLSASVAEVSVAADTGKITVHHVWAVADVGLPLQPDTIRAQMEGGILFGLSAALHERATLRDGVIQESNFDTYEVLRMWEAPPIEVAILQGSDTPTEVGELGLPSVAPAVANAVLALTGRSLRQLPMTPDRVKAALAT